MFKFPLSMLKSVSDIPVDYDNLLDWLRQQGFEIASIEKQIKEKQNDCERKG